MPRPARTYRLTSELVAAYAGAPVVCLDAHAVGREYRLHARRPDASLNRRVRSDGYESVSVVPIEVEQVTTPALIRVDVRGVLEQRAGYHDVCGGWTDGHDAVAERLCAAMAEGDVLLVVDSPGGACAGLQEAVRTVLAAKAEHGRRITAWAGEMVGSAAAWWVLSVADELWTPPAGVIGSIGARSSHCSIAGALAREGVEYTHFAWPNEGKVALAPDQPLTEIGRSRAQRDVTLAGEAFAAAVVAGPIGQRHGLTRDALVALSADALTGQAAVDAGLADGLASLDEVVTYALALASGEEGSMASEYEKTTKERFVEDDAPAPAESEETDPKDEDAEEEETPAESEDDAPEKDAEEDEDEAPPSAKPKEAAATARAKPPAAMRQSASLASILGASADTPIAIKTAAIRMRQVYDHAAKVTGQRSGGEIIGGLSALAEDAAAAGELRGKLQSERRRSNERERVDLLNKLAAAKLPGYARGDLFVDAVDDAGKRTGVRPAPVYAEMKLSTLRGLVSGKLANGGRKRSTPFEPDPEAAEAAAKELRQPGGKPTAAQLEAAKKNPTVLGMFNRPGNTLSLDRIAESFVAHGFGGAK